MLQIWWNIDCDNLNLNFILCHETLSVVSSTYWPFNLILLFLSKQPEHRHCGWSIRRGDRRVVLENTSISAQYVWLAFLWNTEIQFSSHNDLILSVPSHRPYMICGLLAFWPRVGLYITTFLLHLNFHPSISNTSRARLLRCPLNLRALGLDACISLTHCTLQSYPHTEQLQLTKTDTYRHRQRHRS